MTYTAEKALKDNADKISAEIKTGVEGKITALKEVKDKDDVDAVKKATEELSVEMQKIGEHMAKENQEPKTENKEQGERRRRRQH